MSDTDPAASSATNPRGHELYAPAPQKQRRTWTALAIPLAVVFIIGGAIIGTIPGVASGFITPEELTGDGVKGTAYQLIVAFGAATILTLAYSRVVEGRGLALNGLNENGLVRFARGYVIGMAFLAAVIGVIAGLGGYAIEGPGALSAPAALTGVGILFIGFIIQGSTEEIILRGWLMGLIASRHGLVLAVILNSALFALLHGGNMEPSKELATGLANIVLFGLFISLYAAKEGSVWGVCGWHAAWNWLLEVGFGIEVSGQVIDVQPLVMDLASEPSVAWWITGGDFGPEASVVTTAVLLAGTAFLMARGGFARR